MISYVLSRFKGGRAKFLTLPRHIRRKVLAEIYKEHTENRKIYKYVMRGGV